MFLEQGYASASVNDVVRLAGGSLATLYAQFHSKDGLFQAVVLDLHARFSADMAPESVDHLPFEEGLRAIGLRYLKALLEPDNLAFVRLITGEGRHFPPETRRDVAAGAERVRNVVADFMRSHGYAIAEDDACPAMLLELWRGRFHYLALVDDQFRPRDEELENHVAQAVQVFLHGIENRRC